MNDLQHLGRKNHESMQLNQRKVMRFANIDILEGDVQLLLFALCAAQLFATLYNTDILHGDDD